MILYNPTVSGSLLVTGSLTTTGTITSQTLVVQTITSSIEFNTGSTRNGTLLTNTHEFTGSVLMTGSVYMSGGTLQVGGTTEPGKISLFQSDTKTYSASTSNDADLFIVRVNPSAISNQIASLQLVSSGNNGSNAGRGIISVIQTNQAISSGDITFQNNNAGTIAERMRITSSGSIGIGTSSPEGPLHISGSNAGGYIGMAITNYNEAAGTSVGIDFGTDQSTVYNGNGNGQILITNTGGAATTYRSEMLLKTWNGSSLVTGIKISDVGKVSFPTAVAQNYGVSNATAVTVNTSTPTTIASVTITTNGKPVLLVASGDGNPDQAGGWHNLRLYRDSTPVGKLIISENAGGSSANCPFALTHIDTPSAGTYTYTVKAWQGNASFTYGETGNDQAPTLCVVELL
jgi:hypothetical protein